MMEREEQERREMLKRQKDDRIRQTTSSTDYTTQSLRAISPPSNRAPHVNVFDTGNDTGIYSKNTIRKQ